nr:hypothetical protein [Streptomyces lavendulae]
MSQEKVLHALLGWMLDKPGWREGFMWDGIGHIFKPPAPNGEDAPGDDVAGPGIGFGDGRSTEVSFVPLPCQVSGVGNGQRSCLTVEFWAAWPGGEAA